MVRFLRLAAASVVAAAGLCSAAADFVSCASEGGATIFSPGDADFDGAVNRALYPDPKPAYYADVTSASQIPAVVTCAKEEGISICPRSGGHSFIGQSSCSGVVIDVWQMKAVKYDSSAKTVSVEAGNTLAEMFYEISTQSSNNRMLGIGLCPSVGVGGYMLAGGHNPYSGKLGLTCESVVEYEFVTLEGKFVKASATENQELFWASCGGGGGHFAVMYRFTAKTHDAAPFEKNVFFRYEWPIANAGEVLSKWLDYDQNNGDTWFRLEVNANTGIYGYGVCWDAGSVDDCEGRLSNEAFFNVENRFKHGAWTGNLFDFQLFIGPAGRWGWAPASATPKEGLLGQNWDEGGAGINRVYASAFWKPNTKPSVEFLQKQADICSNVAAAKVGFTLCQWNPWKGQQIATPAETHSFASRDSEVFTEFIGSANAGDIAGGMGELKRIEKELKDHTGDLISSVYVAYPEPDYLGLDQEAYSYLYWGQSLPRLAALKSEMDPDSTFESTQPMPGGDLACPGKLSLEGADGEYTIGVDGYQFGARPGMHLAFVMASDCSVKSATNGEVVEADATGGSGVVYDAMHLTSGPISITVSGEECKPELVAINGISCNAEYTLKSNQPASSGTKETEPTTDDGDDGLSSSSGSTEKSGVCFPASATVETETRGVISMDSLSIGDRVRVVDGSFSPVYFFSHRSPAVSSASFVTVAVCEEASSSSDSCDLSSMRRVTLTDTHYLPTAAGGLKAAGALRAGDALARGQVVVSVTAAGSQAGLYNPHTVAGSIVVDGVVTSCYTTAIHPTLARVLLTPLVALYRLAHITPAFKSVLDLARPHLGPLAGPLVL